MIWVGGLTKKLGITRRDIELQSRFGADVRDRRRRLGISQEELGSRAGLHRTYITDIERGVRNISLKSVARLSRALEVSMGSLFEISSASPPGAWERSEGRMAAPRRGQADRGRDSSSRVRTALARGP